MDNLWEDKKIKVIKNPKIANQLLEKGFRIVMVKPSKENKQKTYFAFEWSVELQQTVDKLLA